MAFSLSYHNEKSLLSLETEGFLLYANPFLGDGAKQLALQLG
ncbi:hypothetical protein CLOLEP_00508 [[Clostridium] leptum DSM 753]|uniref:Uncharacterized protein n=1 Tax=[Clostridium] leptum DSM 753 TaxID=428125 RepID=A7VPN2_9FIRM|nr:hypothetical protein CLOLEP_00508 [[Clostridium] leptum DSM 753]